MRLSRHGIRRSLPLLALSLTAAAPADAASPPAAPPRASAAPSSDAAPFVGHASRRPAGLLPVVAAGQDPGSPGRPADGEDDGRVVRAVLFHSPTCPHCLQVIEDELPPLLRRYGVSLVVAAVDASRPDGNALYQATVLELGIPRDRLGVPTLVVGSEVLVGSGEIPARLPGLVEEGLDGGGVAWPPVPVLRRALGRLDRASDIQLLADGTPASGPLRRFMADPVANGAAVGVLLVMVGVLATVGRSTFGTGTLPHLPAWMVPALALAGTGVAAYLSFVEVTGAEAMCGPVGDCGAVQQSRYARLFGVVPVGTLGLAGYAGILGLWAVSTAAPAPLRIGAWRLIWAMALFGTGLSLYLTFLEPFVIGATCAWCLGSALLISGVLLTATSRVHADALEAGAPPPSRRRRG